MLSFVRGHFVASIKKIILRQFTVNAFVLKLNYDIWCVILSLVFVPIHGKSLHNRCNTYHQLRNISDVFSYSLTACTGCYYRAVDQSATSLNCGQVARYNIRVHLLFILCANLLPYNFQRVLLFLEELHFLLDVSSKFPALTYEWRATHCRFPYKYICWFVKGC